MTLSPENRTLVERVFPHPSREGLFPSSAALNQLLDAARSEAIAAWNRRYVPGEGDGKAYSTDIAARACGDAATAPQCKSEGETEALLREVFEAACGLTFGEDWNQGTGAKTHGYRARLLKAVGRAGRALGVHVSPQAERAALTPSTPPAIAAATEGERKSEGGEG